VASTFILISLLAYFIPKGKRKLFSATFGPGVRQTHVCFTGTWTMQSAEERK
jgi:hypothetical protein